uniref:Candidate secreted effector n=1 Tax=Meloidogyne incognita TaxID=6306 RepID=A0A914L7C4_MELIC
MTEKGSSDSDLELKLHEQSNNLLQLQTNFNNLQLKYFEEKEKTFNLEKKNEILENKLKELNEKIHKINFDSNQKDEKINSLEEKIKNKADKNIADLTINSGELNILNFVETKNKWKVFDDEYKCCENNCVNTDNPKGVCIEGNGFANLINEENIKYINCVEKWGGLFGFGRKKIR